MSSGLQDRITQAMLRRSLAYWKTAAQRARNVPLSELHGQKLQAEETRQAVNDLLHCAEERLALPPIGSNGFACPADADWNWRPEMWRGPVRPMGGGQIRTKQAIGSEITLFHDCPAAQIIYRQTRNASQEDLAPYALNLEVFAFAGTFLSAVLELPPEAAAGLRKRHLVRLDTLVDLEQPTKIFARLNVQHGPNVEQIVRELPLHEGNRVMVEFDLEYTEFDERRSERLWLDLIIDEPALNRVSFRDLTLSRVPRAEL